jgi:tetratricopeptide (TPR) repeat protein
MQLRSRLMGICVGLSLCLGAATQHGVAAPPERPSGAGRTAFRLSFAPYSKISARRLETMRLTREGRYDAVEALLTPLQQAYERKQVDEFAVAIAFAPFSTSDESLGPALDTWVEKAPKSYSARLSRARYLRNCFYRFRYVERPHSEAAIGPQRVLEIGKRSIADYRAALAMNPRLIIAYGDLIEMADAMGDRALFRETFESALEVAPATWIVRDAVRRVDAVPREQLAAFLADAAKYETENPLLLQLRADVEIGKARQLWRNGRRAEALAIYDEQLATLDVFGYRKDRSRLYSLMKRIPEAYAEIERAIALMPGKYDGYRQRAWVHYENERWADAAADFRRSLEIDPLDTESNRGLGEALQELDDFEGAIRAFEISARWTADPYMYQKIGTLYLRNLRKPKQALAAFEIAVALDPKEKWSWYKHADALDTMGDPRSRESFKRYLALADPNSAEDQKFIAWAKSRLNAPRYDAPPPPADVAP